MKSLLAAPELERRATARQAGTPARSGRMRQRSALGAGGWTGHEPYPEGTLVKEQSRAEVDRITGGRKLHIPSGYAFDALGYQSGAVVHVPDGALSGIPTETWPSPSPTPGSLVWVPDASNPFGHAVHHPLPLPGSRQWRVWDRTMRTRELRGWLSSVHKHCSNMNDPDWHWRLVLDLGWARSQGIDVNAALPAGNLLNHGIPDPGGVIEDGGSSQTLEGTAQGASVSPLLANVYLHYVFDLWADHWRRRHARGDVILVRFADDYVAGFEHRDDAERFLADLRG